MVESGQTAAPCSQHHHKGGKGKVVVAHGSLSRGWGLIHICLLMGPGPPVKAATSCTGTIFINQGMHPLHTDADCVCMSTPTPMPIRGTTTLVWLIAAPSGPGQQFCREIGRHGKATYPFHEHARECMRPKDALRHPSTSVAWFIQCGYWTLQQPQPLSLLSLI